MKAIIRSSLMLLALGTSIDLLMIWWHTLLSLRVDLCGPVKIMTVMFNLMWLLKVMDLLD